MTARPAKRTRTPDQQAKESVADGDVPRVDVAASEAAESSPLPVAATEGDAHDVGFDPVDDRAERFAAANKLCFKDPALLHLALTHRSILSDWVLAGLPETGFQSNERLEFLGDALLGAIVAEYLYRTEPDATEGVLTARRVALIRAETLVRWAREIGLGEALFLAQGERVTSGARDRMLAGAFEALVGAIYLDRGWPATRRFVERFLKRAAAAIGGPAESNPKGHLQEVLQERYRRSPSYVVARLSGPDHARVFTVETRLDGRLLGVGTGVSKREAEQCAARAALESLGGGAEGRRGGGTRRRRGGEAGRREDGENEGGEAAASASREDDTGDVAEDRADDGVSPSPADGRGGRGVRAVRSRRRAG